MFKLAPSDSCTLLLPPPTPTTTLSSPPPTYADGSTIPASHVVLAVGHSARELYHTLLRHEVAITPKPFALGFRIEHPQATIDRIQYGEQDAAKVERGRGKYPGAAPCILGNPPAALCTYDPAAFVCGTPE